MPESEVQTLAAIRALSRINPLTPDILWNSQRGFGLNAWGEKRVGRAILKVATRFRSRRNFGKLRAAVLSGITWHGEEFLCEAERAGLFLADKGGTKARHS